MNCTLTPCSRTRTRSVSLLYLSHSLHVVQLVFPSPEGVESEISTHQRAEFLERHVRSDAIGRWPPKIDRWIIFSDTALVIWSFLFINIVENGNLINTLNFRWIDGKYNFNVLGRQCTSHSHQEVFRDKDSFPELSRVPVSLSNVFGWGPTRWGLGHASIPERPSHYLRSLLLLVNLYPNRSLRLKVRPSRGPVLNWILESDIKVHLARLRGFEALVKPNDNPR